MRHEKGKKEVIQHLTLLRLFEVRVPEKVTSKSCKKLADLKELKPQNVFLVTSSSMQR